MAKKKSCPFCAGEYRENLAACPYCGTMNYKGAEAQYLGKLENVRTDMEKLGNVPAQEVKREFHATLGFIVKAAAVVGVFVLVLMLGYYLKFREPARDPQADYLWKQTYYPVLDELYEKQDYEELVAFYREAAQQDQPIYDWEHGSFCEVLEDVFYLEKVLEQIASGEEPADFVYEDLVYYGWKLDGPYVEDNLSEEDRELAAPYVERYLKDFYSRFEFTQQEREAFMKDRDENYGYPSFDLCKAYIKRWKKEQRKK